MARVTEAQVKDRFEVLRGMFPRLIMEFAYGNQCVSLKAKEGSGVERRLSGYLNRPEMMLWLDGAIEAAGLK